MQHFADKLGGEVKRQVKKVNRSRSTRNSSFFELHFDTGFIKLDQQGNSKYTIVYNNEFRGSYFDLNKAKEELEEFLQE